MLVLAMLASFFIFLMSNTLVQTIISYQQDTNSNKYILLLIPILVLSIFTIIGNTFLNVNKSPLIPALGQLFTGIIILIFIFQYLLDLFLYVLSRLSFSFSFA